MSFIDWLSKVLGLDDPSSPYYLFWSGFFAAIPTVAFIAGIWVFLRKHNCEVHRCPRLGRHTTVTGHHVCRHHHPDGHLTHEHLLHLHRKHHEKQHPEGER